MRAAAERAFSALAQRSRPVSPARARAPSSVAVAIARTDKVPQAILAKAFRGELVPTEAELARAEGRDYEPASVLLERIRKEREAAGPTAGRGRKKATPEKAPAREKRAAAR